VSSVIVGNSITLEAHYRLDGVLTDPALPRVTIRDVNGVAQVTDATPTKLATGIYQYEYAVASNAPLGAWSAEWQGTISGQPLGPIAEYFTVLPVGYVTPTPSSSFTYNIATDVGKVRLYIDDRDMTNATTATPLERRSVIFTDEEVQTFIDVQGGDLNLAAAMALRTIANNRSLLVQRRQIGKTDVDYGTLRTDLLKSAQTFDDMANIGGPADGVAEIVYDDFSLRRIVWNEQLREAQ
jgi:hypothetical protein